MSVCRESTIDNYNQFLNAQRDTPGSGDILLIKFDHEYLREDRQPIHLANSLTRETYVPRGNTALYDAIGQTIDELGRYLREIPETHRPGKVLVVIITDGEENASRRYSRNKIADMIEHQRSRYQWQFVFLGANQDAVLNAERLSIPAYSSMSFNVSDPAAMTATNSSLVRYTRAYRSNCFDPAADGFTDEERNQAMGTGNTSAATTTIPVPAHTLDDITNTLSNAAAA